MLYPSIDLLMKQVDSKYTLVVAAAKRARQLQDGKEQRVRVPSNKNVTIALHEIAEEQVKFVRTKEGIK